MRKSYHSGSVKKSIVIKSSKESLWKKLSNIISMPSWVIDVKSTIFLSKTKRGVGAIRKIVFDDGNVIEEHIVSWNNKESFSYIAVSGLPLRAYFATISLRKISPKTTRVTWESYFNSKKTSKKSFNEFVTFLESFYSQSLLKLKSTTENRT